MSNSFHVIAEAGTNNNGSLQKAKNLVDIAKRAGANSVKFQMINTWGLYLPGNYEYGHYKIEDVIRIREAGEMSDEQYTELSNYAKSVGIPFSSSVFDEKALKLLDQFDPPYIKIASCDLNNIRFLRQVAEYQRKIILSTGMSTLADIENTLSVINKESKCDIVLLHCVSIYPCNLEQTNLSYINTLKSKFGVPVGFSDHTGTSHAACVALSLGATWFEKHFTENKNQEGLDHAYAMEEIGLTDYINDLKAASLSIESQEKELTEKELYTRRRARRSLYAAKDLPVGHMLTDEDVLCVRPENIMQANEIDVLIGQKLTKSIQKYEPFSKSHI